MTIKFKPSRTLPHAAAPLLLLAGGAVAAQAQESSLFHAPPPAQRMSNGQGLSLETVSLLYTPIAPPKVLQVHDLLTVVVNLNERMQSDGDIENRKRGNLRMILADWIALDGLDVKPAEQLDGDPTIGALLNSQYRAEAELSTRNTLIYTIAAEVIDVRPNGNLLIEARRTTTINDEVWERSLSGIIRREDVTPDNKVQSEDIANLRIFNKESGQVRDGYRRGWLQLLYDRYQAF